LCRQLPLLHFCRALQHHRALYRHVLHGRWLLFCHNMLLPGYALLYGRFLLLFPLVQRRGGVCLQSRFSSHGSYVNRLRLHQSFQS
jgi:hypothetical protein